MMNILISIILAFVFLQGCSNAVKYDISRESLTARPYTVAVLPVDWRGGGEKEGKEAAAFFRTISSDKLRSLNYRPLPMGEVDEKYSSLRAAGKSPGEMAGLLNADSVLLIKVTEWDKSRFATYASLRIKASFELYYGNGARLWQAEYGTKESDLDLDTPSMEYAVIKAYEPQVQRFIDAVFSTLPAAETPKKKETFFQWLP